MAEQDYSASKKGIAAGLSGGVGQGLTTHGLLSGGKGALIGNPWTFGAGLGLMAMSQARKNREARAKMTADAENARRQNQIKAIESLVQNARSIRF